MATAKREESGQKCGIITGRDRILKICEGIQCAWQQQREKNPGKNVA